MRCPTARAVVNAAGLVDQVCDLERAQPPRLALSRGVRQVFDHADLPVRNTVVMRTGRAAYSPYHWGGTPISVLPMTTTGAQYYTGTDQDVSYLLATTQKAMPEATLSPDRIVSVVGDSPASRCGSGRASKELSERRVWTCLRTALCGRRKIVGLPRDGRAHC